MTAIRSTFCPMRRTSVEPDFAPLVRLTDRESCSLAERVLDNEGTAYVNRDNEIVAYALDEDTRARLEQDMRELPSLDYCFDLLTETVEDLDFESRDPRRTLKLLREELENVVGELDKDQERREVMFPYDAKHFDVEASPARQSMRAKHKIRKVRRPRRFRPIIRRGKK